MLLISNEEKQDLALAMALLNRAPQSELQSAPEPLLTFKEAMAYLRVSRSTVYRLMWSGQLPGHKVGSTWRFYASELRASVHDATPNVRATLP